MTEGIRLRIEFAQYSARWETTETENSVTLTGFCRICDKKITERTWIVTEGMPEAEWKPMALSASKVDRETFWSHLRMAHPEGFDEAETVI